MGCKLRDGEWLGWSWVLQGGCGERHRNKGAVGHEGEELEVKDHGTRGKGWRGRELVLGRKWPASGYGISLRWV